MLALLHLLLCLQCLRHEYIHGVFLDYLGQVLLCLLSGMDDATQLLFRIFMDMMAMILVAGRQGENKFSSKVIVTWSEPCKPYLSSCS